MSERSERNGWEAGIRTPITASRAPCPTVERPPSTENRAGGNLTTLADPRERGQPARQRASAGPQRSGLHLHRVRRAHRPPPQQTAEHEAGDEQREAAP